MKIYWQIKKKWQILFKITAKMCITLRWLRPVLPTNHPIPCVLGWWLTSHFGELKIPIWNIENETKSFVLLILYATVGNTSFIKMGRQLKKIWHTVGHPSDRHQGFLNASGHVLTRDHMYHRYHAVGIKLTSTT